MCSSVVLNTFILLHDHHHQPSPELFSFCKAETLSTKYKLPIPTSPQSLATTILFQSLWIWLFYMPHVHGMMRYFIPCVFTALFSLFLVIHLFIVYCHLYCVLGSMKAGSLLFWFIPVSSKLRAMPRTQ